jgi:hypothetical protein
MIRKLLLSTLVTFMLSTMGFWAYVSFADCDATCCGGGSHCSADGVCYCKCTCTECTCVPGQQEE